MNKPTDISLSRRRFLKVTAISGVGFAIGPVGFSLAARQGQTDTSKLGHFVRVAKDNSITVVIKHLDMGQGVTTGLTAIVAEEMNADWAQMRWEFAPADAERYNNLFFGKLQGTGGSTSIANSWTQLRQAGAAAKSMLVAAAAIAWEVNAGDLKTEKGRVVHPDGRTVSYGELAEAAAGQPVPQEPALKAPEEFTLIGTNLPRLDSQEKSNGQALYTADIRRPGMLHAVIMHPPGFGAKVASLDDSAALKVPGVKEVVTTPRGVAVLATSHWDALQGRKAVKAEWDYSKAEKRGSEQLWQEYRQLAGKPGHGVRTEGDPDSAMGRAASKISLEFEFPLLAHAAMEPMNCVVELKNGECHLWTGSQFPTVDKQVVAEITGTPQEKVFIHTQFAGGSFGRRTTPVSDYVRDAALIVKAIAGRAPVSLQWSREDDMRAGYYRPMALHRFEAGVDNNQLLVWQQRVVSQSILRGTLFEAMIQGPVDTSIVEGGSTLPYAINNLKVEAHEHSSGIPVLWWRSVGHSHNAFATEVFFDEVARTLGRDPVEMRLDLLKSHPRHTGVLKLAADKAGWGQKLADNQAQGVAVHESFGSFVAQVAQVTVNQDGSYQVDKIVCAVDCGVAVTPDVIRAQMEGGIGMGLGAILQEAISLKEGRVEQSNFDAYMPLRISKMPKIEVHIVPSSEAPSGVGEPGLPPVGPAVANALRRFLKQPVTRLPIGDKLDLA
ncbi:xanthine dehydrogenase family protein molybdopterin-binding subunit [Bowmanella dokdonensis]|uniref:Xanthine dehydrogenase family protein molybdopterin-binding subunit n=1 Tax=Bowmanella dokdonensis TaxID=751969 RepID=A0A939DN51_9ALTE|nr:xanthine dehydrogenase family protein molybdopterin-binding subunit [Bowmanella dokdonensis]MBN7825712.1 xanthine dehydrogenase family protein molybdopterin-binding subunit [Bowmanella dokdonensis]